MGMERGELSHRVLTVLKHKRAGRTFYSVYPLDRLIYKNGDVYLSNTPTADTFVTKMTHLEYDQLEILDADKVHPDRAADAGTIGSIHYHAGISVGRND